MATSAVIAQWLKLGGECWHFTPSILPHVTKAGEDPGNKADIISNGGIIGLQCWKRGRGWGQR